MAVIQFYLNGRQYADLVDRAERLGISEHQLAKHLALTATVDDSDIMLSMRRNTKRGGQRRATPLGG